MIQIVERVRALFARRRADVLLVYPDAVYMPWDDPPIGQRVEAVNRLTVRPAHVVGIYHASLEREHSCNDCRHLRSRMPGEWWICRWETPIVNSITKEPIYEWLAYPPELRPL